jgi:hypothetical protein
MPRMTADKSHPCDCGAEATRLVSAAAFAFAHTPVNGPVPQNTGVHGIDYNPDQVIGRDAAEKWKTIEQREKVKTEAIRDARKQGMDVTDKNQLAKTFDGYRPITETERVAANENRVAANDVNKAISAKLKEKT